MNSNCKTASPGMLAAEALNIMDNFKISALVVVDGQQRPVGALHLHDLLRAGLA
jgi:arabinose-5-phosphate isomerase